jgi:hypothetical protein
MTTFLFSEKTSILSRDFNPPIYLEEDVDYEIALVDFDTYYSIPNIDSRNNSLIWYDANNSAQEIHLPEGAYELNNIESALQREITKRDSNANIILELDSPSSQVIINSNRKLSFDVDNTLGSVLGFSQRSIESNTPTIGDHPINILKINAICIDCNIAGGSFMNGTPAHIIHSFYPTSPPGFKIVEAPSQPIYHPVTTKVISNITVKIVDQDGEIINFRTDIRTLRLHLRKVRT